MSAEIKGNDLFIIHGILIGLMSKDRDATGMPEVFPLFSRVDSKVQIQHGPICVTARLVCKCDMNTLAGKCRMIEMRSEVRLLYLE